MKTIDQNLVEQLKSLLEPGASGGALFDLVDELQPYDLFVLLQEIDQDQQLLLLQSIPPEIAAEILEYFEPLEQYHFLIHLNEKTLVRILNQFSSDNVVQLFAALHPRQAEKLYANLEPAFQAQIRGLMSFPENSAGSLASVDFIAVRRWWTAEQTLDRLRKVGEKAEIYSYLYVLDSLGELVGVLSLRDLILAEPETAVEEIMGTILITAPAEMDQEAAAQLLARYDLVAMPVVSKSGKMVGIITVDDILDIMEEEATEDIHLLGGSQPLDNPYLQSGIFYLFRKRIIWLVLLFVAGAITSNILQHYQAQLAQVVALTFFIPLLIATGGNAGAQTCTTVIRAMVLGDVSFKDFIQVIWREMRMGLTLGLAMAAFGFLWALVLKNPVNLGLVISATIITVVTVSSTIGAAMPIVGKRLGLDPAVFSAPMVTTVVDTVGLLIYFQFARVFLSM